ncbi:MAG: metallopeptidase family protein [Rhodospirillaceae bacterium]|nr:MAG: metallopeptidase family protein [Rhodospirillaceae bacterium]
MMTLLAPTLAEIDEMARAVLDELPALFKRFTADVVVQVAEFPDEEVCTEMELESPFDILGLYQGIALDEKLIESSGALPDMVFLYRRPILDYWSESGEDLRHIVRHVLIHEIGHHFGLSDAEMAAIEAKDTQSTSA